MRCPECGSKSKVINFNYKKNMTVRYRECYKCKNKFTTKEVYEDEVNYRREYKNLKQKLKKLLESAE